MMLVLALLLLGALIPTPAPAQRVGGSRGLLEKRGGNVNGQAQTVPVKPRVLELKAIPASRQARLNKDAKAKYDEGMKYIDHIFYERALECFQQAVHSQPDDVYLRYTVVQLSQYLGDTRTLGDSIKYYDVAIENLQGMVTSPMLNTREKQRAQGALETVTALRHAVGEREEKRLAAGREIAKQYAAEAFKAQDEREREIAQKKEAVATAVKTINTTPGSRTSNMLRDTLRSGAVNGGATFMNPAQPTSGR